jgi:opacity protein-like surface antigen
MISKLKFQFPLAAVVLVVLILMPVTNIFAQEVKKVGTSSAAFLKIPVGARGSALGGAFVATVDDPSALYWNPGGLPRNTNYALMVDHSPWLPGLSYNFIGVVLPVQTFGTVGISVAALATDEMDVTTPANPNGTGEKFDAASVVIGIAYGRSLTDRFTIGGTFKYINERIFNSTATGIAFDIGTIYDTPLPGLRLGFSVSNFGSKLQMDGEDLNVRVDIAPDQLGNNQSVVGRLSTGKYDLPLIMRLGLAYDAWKDEQTRLTLSADGLNPSDNAQSVNVGAELAFLNEMFALRGGYAELFLVDHEKGLTLGAGLNSNIAGNVSFNAGYAYQYFVHLANVNRFTLTVKF